MNVSKAVSAAYLDKWAEPSRRAGWSTDPPIEVWKWDPSATREGVALYWTLGASDTPATLGHQRHRAEFFIGLLPELDEVAPVLAELAHSPTLTGEALGHGHVIRTESSLWPGTSMDCLLTVRPRAPLLDVVQAPGGIHVEFLQVIPIFRSEREFISENGIELLLDGWRDAVTPFWNPRRAAPHATNDAMGG